MRKSHEILAELNTAMEQFAQAEGEARAALATKIDNLTSELREAQVDEAARRAIANQRVLSNQEKRELQRFSISKFLREAREGQLTGLEADLAKEGESEFKRAQVGASEGSFLPSFLVRDYTYTNATETDYGKALVTEGQMTYIEALRNAMVASKLGVRFLDGLSGQIPFVKGGGATAAWYAEEAQASVSKPTYAKYVMKPHGLQIIQGVTYDLLHSSNAAIDALIMDDLRKAHAAALDAAIFTGSGSSGEPQGIIGTTGVGAVAIDTNGGPLTFAKLVEFETTVGVANGLYGQLAYVTNAKVNGAAKTTPQIAGYPLYLINDGKANGYPVEITNSIPSNGKKGSSQSGVLSSMIFGNFNEVIVGGWGGLQFIIDPYSEKDKRVIEISAHAYHDVFVRRPECFAVATDIATA